MRGSEVADELDLQAGPPHFIDQPTERLHVLAGGYEDLQKTRIGLQQRGLDVFAAGLEEWERKLAHQMTRALRNHPVWPWLRDYPGLGGVHTARLLSYIRDPLRFPGVRSVWHYCGLHVVNGRSPRMQKGRECDWNPGARTAVLMPMGIADHIVQQRVEPYRTSKYDATKARLQAERGTYPELSGGAESESTIESGSRGGLRPFQIDAIARKVAAKAFVADLWRAWRDIVREELDG